MCPKIPYSSISEKFGIQESRPNSEIDFEACMWCIYDPCWSLFGNPSKDLSLKDWLTEKDKASLADTFAANFGISEVVQKRVFKKIREFKEMYKSNPVAKEVHIIHLTIS